MRVRNLVMVLPLIVMLGFGLFARSGTSQESDRETRRLVSHFKKVLDELASADVEHLTSEQRRRRSARIRELSSYAASAQFARNTDFSDARVPYFVDGSGTRCAMAHVIEQSGSAELVARIATEENNAFIPELSEDRELRSWLDRNGLSLEEAARIQPAYGFDETNRDRTRVARGVSIGLSGATLAINFATDHESLLGGVLGIGAAGAAYVSTFGMKQRGNEDLSFSRGITLVAGTAALTSGIVSLVRRATDSSDERFVHFDDLAVGSWTDESSRGLSIFGRF
ncbi:MAG: hypothetical protein AAF219_08425 [Myxococcota bacterium]